jgi:hypothetical protein
MLKAKFIAVCEDFFTPPFWRSQWPKEMIRQKRQITPNNANKNAWLLTSVSEPFAFLASFGGFSSVAPERRWVIGG